MLALGVCKVEHEPELDPVTVALKEPGSDG